MNPEAPDRLRGKPYTLKERLYPARWHGFARREVEQLIFEWDLDHGNTGVAIPLARTIEESSWVWRGFSREARKDRTTTLESGLMPGAVAREIARGE